MFPSSAWEFIATVRLLVMLFGKAKTGKILEADCIGNAF